jgi:hypothetical protein
MFEEDGYFLAYPKIEFKIFYFAGSFIYSQKPLDIK